MNPMYLMAMANQKKRPAPTDRPTHRLTKAQVGYIEAIERDTTKEIYHVSEFPEKLFVEILDHTLSLSFGGPVVVTVNIDLLANEKSIEIVKTGVEHRRLISWQNHGTRQQTNIWHPSNCSSPVYWDGTPGHYYNNVEAKDRYKEQIAFTEAVARALFCSATDGGSPEYRGSRLTNASLEAAKKKHQIA